MKFFEALKIVKSTRAALAPLGLDLDKLAAAGDVEAGVKELRVALGKKDARLAPFVNDPAAFAREVKRIQAQPSPSVPHVRAGSEATARLSALQKENHLLRINLDRTRKELGEKRARIAARTKRHQADGEALSSVLCRFMTLNRAQLTELLKEPAAFKAKLEERIELKGQEQLAKHGINCAPLGYHPAKPRLTGLARTTAAFKRNESL